MPNKRDLILDEFNIDKFLYRELHNYCLQYPYKKARIADSTSLGAQVLTGMPRGTGISNPTQNKALALDGITHDIEIIERCAHEVVGEDMYPILLTNVTTGRSPESMGLGWRRRTSFYASRRKFFYLLAIKLRKI